MLECASCTNKNPGFDIDIPVGRKATGGRICLVLSSLKKDTDERLSIYVYILGRSPTVGIINVLSKSLTIEEKNVTLKPNTVTY